MTSSSSERQPESPDPSLPTAPRVRRLVADAPRPAPGSTGPTAATGTQKRHTLPGTLLLMLLAAFALFDRPAALLTLPGVPVYPAEIVLAICVGFLLTRRDPFRGVPTRNWLAPTLLVVFLGWGLLKILTSLHYALLDVVRDSALSYYALFALVVIGLSRHDSRFEPSELVRLYGRFVPWLLALAPIRIIGASLFDAVGPTVPGTGIQLTSHRLGNLGCAVALAVVYLAGSGRQDRRTVVGIVSGIIMLLVIGTQNRGGMLSGSIAILVAAVIWGRHIKLRLLWVVLMLACAGVLAWGTDLRIETGNREISVEQLTNNVSSIVGGGNNSAGQVNATVNFRTDLWERVLAATVSTGRLETGWGFGPNLGSDFLPDHSDRSLRNPHNSHMTVIARLGLVGIALWLTLWLSWLSAVLRRARLAVRQRTPWSDDAGRLALLAGVGATAILVNAYVDPTLETPMVAVWLWSLFGFGVLAVVAGRGEPAVADAGLARA